MTVKELKEKVAAIPAEYDDARVYAYSSVDEGADDVNRIKIYNEETHAANQGTPYCGGDAPWEIDWKTGKIKPWKGSPAFVVIG